MSQIKKCPNCKEEMDKVFEFLSPEECKEKVCKTCNKFQEFWYCFNCKYKEAI